MFCGAFFPFVFFFWGGGIFVCWLVILMVFSFGWVFSLFLFVRFIFKLGEGAEKFKNLGVCIYKEINSQHVARLSKKLKPHSIHFPGDTILSFKSMFTVTVLRFPEML